MNTELTHKSGKQATEVRRAGLIGAALHLAGVRSPAEITTADLARAVGISQGAVFRHFASKEDIWLALVDWSSETLLGQLQKAAALAGGANSRSGESGGHSTLQSLQAVFEAHVNFVMAHPGFPRVVLQELQHADSTPLKSRVSDLMQKYRVLVMGLLQRAQAQNLLLPGTDLQAAVVLFLGAVQGLVMQAMVSSQVQNMAAQAPGVFAIYLRGIATHPLTRADSPRELESTP